MEFSEAADVVRRHGRAMLMDPDGCLAAVAVGRKEGGPIAGAKDFSITAFVPKKLSGGGNCRFQGFSRSAKCIVKQLGDFDQKVGILM